VVDEWDGRSPLQPGDLALTNADPAFPDRYRLMSLDEALAAA